MSENRLSTVQVLRRFCLDEWGGTETVVWNTSMVLCSKGHRTEILSTSALNKPGYEIIDGIGIRRFKYFYPYLNLKKQNEKLLDKKGGDPYSVKLFQYLMHLKNIDIIHCHTMGRLANIVKLAAHRKGIPYIISLHGGCYDVPKSEIEGMMRPLKGTFNYGKLVDIFLHGGDFLKDADGIICVGYNEYQLAKEKYGDKPIAYLPNGVDVAKYGSGEKCQFREKYNIGGDSFVILCVGRIDYQKNQKLLIELVKTVKNKGHDVHLVLIGAVTSIEYMGELERLVQKYSLENNITIIKGVRADSPDLIDAYSCADCFILPSVHEPFGIVILEAWAASKPVIAANVGGVSKLINDGVTGLLFESGDIEGLSEKFIILKENEELRSKLAENGRAKVEEEYSWEIVTDKLTDFYCDVKKHYEANK